MTAIDIKRDQASAIHRIIMVAARSFFLLAVIGLILCGVLDGLGVPSLADELRLRLPATIAASIGFYLIAWPMILWGRYGARSLGIIPVLAWCAWLVTAGRTHMPVASIVLLLACLGCALGAAILLITLRVVLHRELKLGANI